MPEQEADGPEHRVEAREKQYLIAKQDAFLPANTSPLDLPSLLSQLEKDPEVTVERVMAPRSLSLFATSPTPLQNVIVARMSETKAAQIEQHPQVLIEEDLPLNLLPEPGPPVDVADPSVFIPFGSSTSWRVRVQGPDGSPVPGATVFLYGSGIPAQGRTDAAGAVDLSLLNESDATLRSLYVNPQADYWSLWINQPRLASGGDNVVVCTPLAASFPGFPEKKMAGWGAREMRLDRVPANIDGAGIRVAVIDSGAAATTHPDLRQVRAGIDLTTNPPNPDGWINDTIAHGSHCSGVIAGASATAGIRGFAPKAEVHEARIFPGGRVSTLLDAVDYCMDNQIDVVNMSLGAGASSQLMLQKLAQAKEQGVACIVAAGNSANQVQFPGTSPDVLTVAAIGKLGEFPPSSYHAQQVPPGAKTDAGLFSAKFSCHGPEVDVCGPGVAIVSSVPTTGYAAWDGTSMATPHVTGLAALVLAHHPDFQGPFAARDSRRVDRLFGIIKGSARPVDVGDPNRTGVGLPDAPRALGLDGAPPQPLQAMSPDQQRDQLWAALLAAGIVRRAGPGITGQQPARQLGHMFMPQSTGPGSATGHAPASAVPAHLGDPQAWATYQPPGVQAALAKLAAALEAAGVRTG